MILYEITFVYCQSKLVYYVFAEDQTQAVQKLISRLVNLNPNHEITYDLGRDIKNVKTFAVDLTEKKDIYREGNLNY